MSVGHLISWSSQVYVFMEGDSLVGWTDWLVGFAGRVPLEVPVASAAASAPPKVQAVRDL